MLSVSTFVSVYLIGLGLVWLIAAVATAKEPTTHGQDVLSTMGCALGILWPLVPPYLLFFVLPYWLISKWRGDL